jgi:hypothetical protein
MYSTEALRINNFSYGLNSFLSVQIINNWILSSFTLTVQYFNRGDNLCRSNAIPIGRGEGDETGQSESSLAISHSISIPFEMAFWD